MGETYSLAASDREMMDYFRAMVAKSEFSERSFELAGFVLESISTNYNAFLIRRRCLESLPQLSYKDELTFTT